MAFPTIVSLISIGQVGTQICLSAISSTCSSAVGMVGHFVTATYPGLGDLNDFLRESDLVVKIDIIRLLIDELNADPTRRDAMTESTKKTIKSVSEVVVSINNALIKIKKIREDHDKKMFAGWRSIDCTTEIATVKLQGKLLTERLDLMLKIINLKR